MSDYTVNVSEPLSYILDVNVEEPHPYSITIEAGSAADIPNILVELVDNNYCGAFIGGSNINVEDVQEIIGTSGVIGGSGISTYYNNITGLTSINASGLTLGTVLLHLGGSYQDLMGLSSISGTSISSPTIIYNCVIDGGTP
jgi:hypothetical protein